MKYRIYALKQASKWFGVAAAVLYVIDRVLLQEGLLWPVLLPALVSLALLGVSEYLSAKEDEEQPVTTVCAKYLLRRKARARWTHHRAEFYLSFRDLNNQRRLEFEVPFTEYGSYEPGQTGMLTYQGRRFISFVPSAAPALEVKGPIVMQEYTEEAGKPDD